MLQMQFTLKLDNPDVGREGCIAGVTGRDTTSCKVGNIWGVFILSSFDSFDVNIWGVFRVVSPEDFSWRGSATSVSTEVADNGITPDEQDAVLSLFNVANDASNGLVEATVEEDWGVVCIVDPVPMDTFWIQEPAN